MNFEKIPYIGYPFIWLRENNMDFGIHLSVVNAFIAYLAFTFSPTLITSTLSFFFGLAPIWFPMIAIDIFHFRWMDYVNKKYFLKQGRTQYRIKLPQEVTKSPEAMEYVFTHTWNKQTQDNYWQTYIDGKTPLFTSFEIASIGGDVRFYVNLPTKKVKEAFTAAMYSQYPGIELVEEPVDYAAEVPVGDPEWDVWSTHIGKKESTYGPIKTYIDFKLDTLPKEEEKVDPITIMIEHLSSIGPNERIYFQFLTRAFIKPSLLTGALMWPWQEGPNWTKAVQARIDELMRRDPETKAPLTNEGTDFDGAPRLTPGEREDIEALERHKSKTVYNVGIRYLYMAKKGHFRSTIINPTNRVFSQFDKIGRASLGMRWRTDFNYMWFSDPFGERLKKLKSVEQYFTKVRKYVPHSQKDGSFLMTSEELATIYHIPGRVALTPTLSRIPSTRSEAPVNLPVGELPTNT